MHSTFITGWRSVLEDDMTEIAKERSARADDPKVNQ
jgi:hypothetical protein